MAEGSKKSARPFPAARQLLGAPTTVMEVVQYTLARAVATYWLYVSRLTALPGVPGTSAAELVEPANAAARSKPLPLKMESGLSELKMSLPKYPKAAPCSWLVPRRVTTETTPPAPRPYSALAVEEVTRNSWMASFTWKGMAWPEFEATLSIPSSRKLLELGRWPAMEKLAPERADPASTSCVFGVSRPSTRKFRL